MTINGNSNERAGMKTEYNEYKLPANLLTVSEVARFLGVHSSTVRRWEKEGVLKSYAIGLRGNLRFKEEDILKCVVISKRFKQDVINFLQQSTHGVSLSGDLDKVRHKIKAERR